MSIQYTEENLIRAVEFLPSEEEKQRQLEALQNTSDPLAAMMFADDRDTVLYGIFGDIPDYDNPEIEALWDEVLDAEPEEVYEYCFRKGVDLFNADGQPVTGWRDIAVMLKALDTGLLQLA